MPSVCQDEDCILQLHLSFLYWAQQRERILGCENPATKFIFPLPPPGVDSCSGDSGGPLFSRARSGKKSDPLFLTGVVSYGTNLCGVGVPGVYTNVTHYIDWIRSELKP